MITLKGIVLRLLSDDLYGSRHQRFIIEVAAGPWAGKSKEDSDGKTVWQAPAKTILVSHNIDIAPRIPDLEVGGRITLKGKYHWNELGGLMHWTHDNPEDEEDGGWIEWRGELYA